VFDVDELIEHIPPIACYRREPLADRHNALFHWEQAAESLATPDGEGPGEALFEVDPDGPAELPSGADANRVRQFLEDNRRAIELLRAGVSCGRVQFPEPDDEGDFAEDAQAIRPLANLANTWLLLARWLIADGDYRAAASELAQLGQMAQMICGGEGLVVHYLVGTSIMHTAAAAIRRLAAEPEAPEGSLAELAAAIDRWLNESHQVAQCLRMDLCCYALREVDRLARCQTLEAKVDELLDRHYAGGPLVPPVDEDEACRHDGRLAWRREQILRLLEGHPQPFDEVGTVKMMGRHVADRILDLQPMHPLNLPAHWGRVVRRYRRRRLEAHVALWPTQLHPSFPYELLGPSDDARHKLTALREHLPNRGARLQPPGDIELKAARRRLHATVNPLGVLVADALLPIDISSQERDRRERLRAAKAAIAASRG